MGTISKRSRKEGQGTFRQRLSVFLHSSQLWYAAAIILITFVGLLFLNIYAPRTIRNLIFSSQKTAMTDKAQLIVSAFSSYDSLDSQTVNDVIHSVNDLHTTRLLVTDANGYCLYDSLGTGSAVGKLTLFPEIAEALSGTDAVYIRYENNQFISKAAMPIMAYNRLTGAIYLLENDRDQAELAHNLQKTVLAISIALEAAIVLFALLFAELFSRKMQNVLLSVRRLHHGDYSVRLPERGNDEVARLGSAFNELAERLNQSEVVRKQFVSNASHELKTPLASIKLLSDSILQNEMDASTVREFVTDIGNEADRLTRLSSKLLELTRLDSKPVESREPVNVETVAERVLRMLVPLARRQSVHLDLDCAPECMILATEDDLYQILFNLVENGVKYNRPDGFVKIYATQDDAQVIIRAEDSGFGIPEESKPHIFERFYRVDKARSRKAGGAGLGLSIVHDKVLRYGGEISVQDRAGGGTCFTLTFPRENALKEVQK